MYKVLCKDKTEAERLLKSLNDIINVYGFVTVKDLCELAEGDFRYSYVDETRGWAAPISGEIVSGELSTELQLPEPYYIAAADPDNKPDMVNHPPHYQSKNGLEAIHVIEAFTEKLHGIEATDTGNVIKYILRWPEKNGLQDLKKAKWYLEHLINHIEKENDNHE